MILIPILLVFLTGLLILWLCSQHKYLNIFEQLTLGFCTALSLFVFELFVGGIIFDTLSLIGPIISFVVCVGLLIYKNKRYPGFIKEIVHHIKADFEKVKIQFQGLKNRQQYVVIGIGLYVIFKLVMIFSINLYTPTFDDDAVTGWDLKTKIFASTHSLVLDKTNPEYFGVDYGRYPFAGIVDTYFLLPLKGDLNGFTNIISPLLYVLSIFLLFGIFLRKTNVFWASVSGYLFTSLPFVFIHGSGAYRNFPAGMFLFIFIFYVIDQVTNIDDEHKENKNIIFPLLLVGFLSSCIRNESTILTGIVLIISFVLYHILKKGRLQELKLQAYLMIPIITTYIINKYVFSLYPSGAILNTGGAIKGNIINAFFDNINGPGVFVAPFQQMFYHPDYILLFILYTLALILFVIYYKKMSQVKIFVIMTFSLMMIFIVTLYTNPQGLGLLSHFAFIRYPVSMVGAIIYSIGSVLYLVYEHKKIQ